MLSVRDYRALVYRRALVRTAELLHAVFVVAAVVGLNLYPVGVDVGDGSRAARNDAGAGVLRYAVLDARAHDRRVGEYERDGLALHVGAHERSVGVVVLEERNERRRNGDYLLRRYVEVVELLRVDLYGVVLVTDVDAAGRGRDDVAVLVHREVGASDIVFVLFVRGEIGDLFRDLSVDYLAARADEEAVFVYAREGRERGDESDVRAFRRFYRADAAVVRVVDVAGFESGAFARKASGAERGEAAAVRKLGERVRLVHELRELARAEEFAERRGYRADVDEVLRHRGREVGRRRHAFARDALHAEQPDADLVLEQLADGAHAAVAEVVDVVHVLVAVAQADEALDYRDDVCDGQQALCVGYVKLEPAVDLIASDAAEVVAARVEEYARYIFACVFHARRFVRAQFAEEFKHRFVWRVRVVALDGHGERRVYIPDPDFGASVVPEHFHMLFGEAGVLAYFDRAGAVRGDYVLREKHSAHVVVDEVFLHFLAVEEVDELVRALHAEGAEHLGDGDFFAVVYLDGEHVARRKVELDPRAAVWDELRDEGLLSRDAELGAVVDSGGTRELVDDYALRSVDYEGSPFGHGGEVAQVDVFFFDFAALLVHQTNRRAQRSRPCKVPAARLIQTDGHGIDVVSYEFKRERAVVAFDGEYFIEELLKPLRGAPVRLGVSLKKPLV